VYERAKEMKNLRIVGVDCHIGSQLLNTKPFGDSIARLRGLISESVPPPHTELGRGVKII